MDPQSASPMDSTPPSTAIQSEMQQDAIHMPPATTGGPPADSSPTYDPDDDRRTIFDDIPSASWNSKEQTWKLIDSTDTWKRALCISKDPYFEQALGDLLCLPDATVYLQYKKHAKSFNYRKGVINTPQLSKVMQAIDEHMDDTPEPIPIGESAKTFLDSLDLVMLLARCVCAFYDHIQHSRADQSTDRRGETPKFHSDVGDRRQKLGVCCSLVNFTMRQYFKEQNVVDPEALKKMKTFRRNASVIQKIQTALEDFPRVYHGPDGPWIGEANVRRTVEGITTSKSLAVNLTTSEECDGASLDESGDDSEDNFDYDSGNNFEDNFEDDSEDDDSEHNSEHDSEDDAEYESEEIHDRAPREETGAYSRSDLHHLEQQQSARSNRRSHRVTFRFSNTQPKIDSFSSAINELPAFGPALKDYVLSEANLHPKEYRVVGFQTPQRGTENVLNIHTAEALRQAVSVDKPKTTKDIFVTLIQLWIRVPDHQSTRQGSAQTDRIASTPMQGPVPLRSDYDEIVRELQESRAQTEKAQITVKQRDAEIRKLLRDSEKAADCKPTIKQEHDGELATASFERQKELYDRRHARQAEECRLHKEECQSLKLKVERLGKDLAAKEAVMREVEIAKENLELEELQNRMEFGKGRPPKRRKTSDQEKTVEVVELD